MVKNPANARDTRDSGSIPGLGRSPGEGNGNPLQYSCLEKNPMDRRAWWAIVHGVTNSRTQLSDFTFFLLLPVEVWKKNGGGRSTDYLLGCEKELLLNF